MFEFDSKRKYLIIIVICIIVLIVGYIIYYFLQNNNEEEYIEDEIENDVENSIENNLVENTETIVVHISGQVINSGVITLNKLSRVIDAINVAGGPTAKADLGKVNLAYIIEDGQRIYIPSIDEKVDTYILDKSGDTEIVISGSGNKNTHKEEKVMININTANEEELQKLPGVGSSIAIRIVQYRKENGKFNKIEDIKNISGIGDSKFDKIKNNIFVK